MLRYTRSHVQIKQHLQIKSERLIFYRSFLPVQISTVCGSSTTINATCWGNRDCGQGLSLKRSFTSCSEAQVKPRACPSLIWTSIRPVNGQITRTTLKSSSVRSLWCGEHGWKKLLRNRSASLRKHPSLPVNDSQLFSAPVLVQNLSQN